MDVSAKNSKGELIGNQFRDYKICNLNISTSSGITGFWLVNYVTDESIKFDNVQFYQYKISNEIVISKLDFVDINGDAVKLDAVKSNDQVFCTARFNVAEGLSAMGIFAVYDENENLVSTKCVELQSGLNDFDNKLFTAEQDGSYIVKLFMWEDIDGIVPIKNAICFVD